MNVRDLKGLDKGDMLAMVGLQERQSQTGRLLATLGTFGVGMLVGVGVALLLAPKTGRELRRDIGRQLRTESNGESVVAG